MKYKYILGIDPSGAFNEGKGTTGYSVYFAPEHKFTMTGTIVASGHIAAEAYWHKHIEFLNNFIFSARGKRKHRENQVILVIEDYLLYANKAESQIYSRMETSKLIGIIQHWCWINNIPYCMQPAAQVKQRWADPILEHKGYIKKKGGRYDVCEHTRDSMRHAIHYATFKNGDDGIEVEE